MVEAVESFTSCILLRCLDVNSYLLSAAKPNNCLEDIFRVFLLTDI